MKSNYRIVQELLTLPRNYLGRIGGNWRWRFRWESDNGM